MKKKKLPLLVLSIIFCLLLAACGSKSANETSDGNKSKKEPIKIGFSALPSWYLWHLVEKKGFFEKHGVDVELVWFPVYADSLSALNTGEIDGNSQALLDSISPLEKGIDLKAVFITDNSLGGDGLVASNDIRSIKDLKGKKVGTEIGTIEHFFLLTALHEAGLKESDVKFTNLSVQDAGNSFIAGKLDAAGLWEPFLSMAVNKGKGHKLVTSADFPGLISDLFVVRGDVAKERKEDVQKIVAAWFDAVDYLSQNYDQSIQLIADEAGISKEELDVGMKGFKLFSPEESLNAFKEGDNYQSFYYTAEKNAEFLKELGFIKDIPDFSSFVDTSFIKAEIERAK
ncbi:ABC transporter substrate-binding protein [Aeribacillus sp. FSL W8-0870]|uniref:ABC transporter substrate-binding protein n=1 Tax=Aeribacillus sp. FSL W8-0870 TaxID=2954706 RepID=UPI0030D0CA87